MEETIESFIAKALRSLQKQVSEATTILQDLENRVDILENYMRAVNETLFRTLPQGEEEKQEEEEE